MFVQFRMRTSDILNRGRIRASSLALFDVGLGDHAEEVPFCPTMFLGCYRKGVVHDHEDRGVE